MVVGFILTSTTRGYEDWLLRINGGKEIRPSDLIEFPRITSVEQWKSVQPFVTVYTVGNYYTSDKMMMLGEHLMEAGAKLVKTPSERYVKSKVI